MCACGVRACVCVVVRACVCVCSVVCTCTCGVRANTGSVHVRESELQSTRKLLCPGLLILETSVEVSGPIWH